jgi:PBP1b-binding outer membrane lipoprotein LpoB
MRKGVKMRGLHWILMMLAMAMFMVGCDSGPTTPPAGVDDAPTVLEVDEDYVPPAEEQGDQEAAEEEPAAEEETEG